jgi:hypothetical protein
MCASNTKASLFGFQLFRRLRQLFLARLNV